MDKHLTYLLINFFTLFFPVVLSFDKRVRFIKSWRHIFPGLVITGGLFLFWDYLFTIYDVWSFNPEYIVGVYILNLPLEEILFFVTVPFACLFIYECLNYYVKKDVLKAASTSITLVLLVLSIAMLVFFSGRVYTLITFGLLLALCIYLLIKRPPYMSRFYLAYLVSLLPFYVVNGILTSIPIVLYNDAENLAFRVGTIPFEDHFYSLAMLLLNVIFFEFFKHRSQSA